MNRHNPALIAALALCLLLALFGSILVGSAALTAGQVAHALAGGGDDPRLVVIIREIRLPRAILGALVGASLSLSGAVLQGLLRNPLAEPGLTGTSASAGLGAVVALYFGWSATVPLALPLTAMGTAGVGTLLLLLIAGRHAGTLTLILTGVALSSLAVALTSLAMNLSPNPYALSEMVMWLLGSLHDRSFADVTLILPFAIVGWIILAATGRGLDALSLGEEAAASLGICVDRLRLWAVLGTALAVGASVAVAGSVGFVGLVVPHLLRPLVRYQPSRLLLPSAFGGAILVTVADIAVRLIPSSSEIMLGVLTSLVGIPFFLALILKLQWADR
ncbi:iron ABC transporter permease [Telmatospirillum sp.]|uniref:FecCD family ABC transporter permease n=1 Tax=Telmatospirillum sp. TaxID=2079197 RepID=UPI00283B96BB|nr:iron ABC transporter permease [Telmatospirillum sp.]MDR3435635.1 iron ABC transporter permease [Telmatospirillum sp.]